MGKSEKATKRACSICGKKAEAGKAHNARTCPQNPNKGVKAEKNGEASTPALLQTPSVATAVTSVIQRLSSSITNEFEERTRRVQIGDVAVTGTLRESKDRTELLVIQEDDKNGKREMTFSIHVADFIRTFFTQALQQHAAKQLAREGKSESKTNGAKAPVAAEA